MRHNHLNTTDMVAAQIYLLELLTIKVKACKSDEPTGEEREQLAKDIRQINETIGALESEINHRNHREPLHVSFAHINERRAPP